jgi:hypothetical protein
MTLLQPSSLAPAIPAFIMASTANRIIEPDTYCFSLWLGLVCDQVCLGYA